VSKKNQWLMASACKAVERLIAARHPAALEIDALAILHKLSVLRGYVSNELVHVKAEYSKLVPAWKELNRALFWFEVQIARQAVYKRKGERLTEYLQVSIYNPFWWFQATDFQYISGEIIRQLQLDDRLIALSIAYYLYRNSNRPRPWREQLKKIVAGNEELSERLKLYFQPSAQSQHSRMLKQQELKWNKREEAIRQKQEAYHAGWKNKLINNLEAARLELRDNPGTITNALLYLFNQSQQRPGTTGRWTEYNWRTLTHEYGEEVALFYRNAAVAFWRYHNPILRSEGAPHNQTTYAVLIGLTGIEIEAHETKNWPDNLSVTEIELACKYASFELNGFPTWFPRLFGRHPTIVGDFLLREIRYELSIETPEHGTQYVLNDVSWSGQWVWDHIAPYIYDILISSEPMNVSNLDHLLKIIQGSTIRDDLLSVLASNKCHSLAEQEHLARWYAVWTGVDPESAITSLKFRITHITEPTQQTWFAMLYVTHLLGGRREDKNAVRSAFKTPMNLKSLYLLINEYIRREDDIDRVGGGIYSPGLRDEAQESRNNLYDLLMNIPGMEAFIAMNDIAKAHPVEATRQWMLLLAKRKAEQDGDIAPWTPAQVRELQVHLERTPSNHRELAELAVLRLLDLKDDLENGDSSFVELLQKASQETEIRNYIGKELRDKAFGRYSIPQEEELADSKKPDLRFHRPEIDSPVPVELKLADKWSGPKLFERLENQLCGDYLRDKRSNRGIFLLVHQDKKKRWFDPNSHKRIDFERLTVLLQEHWKIISPKFSNIDDITVIGIDLTKRFC
jgi:hypothetical protein